LKEAGRVINPIKISQGTYRLLKDAGYLEDLLKKGTLRVSIE
jgi:hypothetical protein